MFIVVAYSGFNSCQPACNVKFIVESFAKKSYIGFWDNYSNSGFYNNAEPLFLVFRFPKIFSVKKIYVTVL